MNYADWISAYVARNKGFVRGLCDPATTEMVKAFPELRRACGLATWNAGHREVRDQHWWCVAPDGMIVDPTAAQFTGQVLYEELNLDNPDDVARIPTGVCMGCGGDVYEGKTFCGDACEGSVMRDMGCTQNADGSWRG